jgi:hypothetical protein
MQYSRIFPTFNLNNVLKARLRFVNNVDRNHKLHVGWDGRKKCMCINHPHSINHLHSISAWTWKKGWCNAYQWVGGPKARQKIRGVTDSSGTRAWVYSKFSLIENHMCEVLIDMVFIRFYILDGGMSRSRSMLIEEWWMVPPIPTVMVIGGRSCQPSCWRCGMRISYLIATLQTLSL